MATKFIPDLPSAPTLSDTDLFAVDDGEHTYKTTWAALKSQLATVNTVTTSNGAITITTANGNTFTVTPHDPTKQDTLTFDNSPTQNSANPVKSGGVYTALGLKLDKNDYVIFRGASSLEEGEAGIVPKPVLAGMYLGSDGVWHTPESAPTAGSSELVTSGGIKAAIDNITIETDDDVSASSPNPVKSSGIKRAIDNLDNSIKGTGTSARAYHLGFYIGEDGGLCQYDD